jgi:hypothetical protein
LASEQPITGASRNPEAGKQETLTKVRYSMDEKTKEAFGRIKAQIEQERDTLNADQETELLQEIESFCTLILYPD